MLQARMQQQIMQVLRMQQKQVHQNAINIEFKSDKYALDDIIDDSQGKGPIFRTYAFRI